VEGSWGSELGVRVWRWLGVEQRGYFVVCSGRVRADRDSAAPGEIGWR
jgi:hypothetical protein